MSRRAEALAERIEQGAAALADFAEGLSATDWQSRVPPDGRTVGVLVHHVASVYPLEISLAQQLAAGTAITDVTWEDVRRMNANTRTIITPSQRPTRWICCDGTARQPPMQYGH